MAFLGALTTGIGTALGGAATAAAYTYGPTLITKLPGRSPIQRMTVDLTDRARQGFLKKASGRRKLIECLSSIITTSYGLGILIGKPGVGKTALVHQLAYLAAEDKIPSLKGVRIVELNLNRVEGKGVASAFNQFITGGVDKFFEDLLAELQTINQGVTKTIVFIDEIHELLNRYPNIFERQKQQLASRGVFILGATTSEEAIAAWLYQSEEAFQRRSQTIKVPEMSTEETLHVLEQLASHKQSLITVSEDGIAAALNLSVDYYPTGVLPDRAIKLLNQVITWAQNTRLGKVTQDTVAEFLSGGLTQTSKAQLLAKLDQNVRHQFLEVNFQPTYFPRCQEQTPSSASFIREGVEQLMCAFGLEWSPTDSLSPSTETPGTEPSELDTLLDAALLDFATSPNPPSTQVTIRQETRSSSITGRAISIQPYRSKEMKILTGGSECVLRDIIRCFASSERDVYMCSLRTLLNEAHQSSSYYQWTQQFLNELAGSPRPVFLYLDEAEPLLEFNPSVHLATPTPSHQVPSTEQSIIDMAHDTLGKVLPLAETMKQMGITAIIPGRAKPVASNPTLSKLPPHQADLIRLFDRFIKEKKIDVIIGTQKPVSDRVELIPLPKMSRPQIIEWLSIPYQDRAEKIPFDRLLLLATQLAPHMAPEDYCFKLLKGVSGDRTNEQNLLNAALTMARGAKSRTEIQQKWEATQALSTPIFQEWVKDADEPIFSTELSHFLTTYSEQTLPFVWMEDPSDVQIDFVQEQIARSLKKSKKRVFRLNLSHIKSSQLIDREQKHIIDVHSEALLQGTPPVVMVKEGDFKNPNLQQRLIELVKAGKIQLICFAKQTKQPSEEPSLNEDASLGGIGQVVKNGIATLGLSNLVSQLQGGSPGPRSHNPNEIQAVTVKNKPISPDILIRYLLTQEMGSEPDSEGGANLTPEALNAFTSLYKFLGSEDGPEISLDEIREVIQSTFKSLPGSPSQDQVINHISQRYGASEGVSSNSLKYAINPKMTPLIYRIWRVFKTAVGNSLQTLVLPFQYVFNSMLSGFGYMAGTSLLSVFRRFLFGF